MDKKQDPTICSLPLYAIYTYSMTTNGRKIYQPNIKKNHKKKRSTILISDKVVLKIIALEKEKKDIT